MRISRRHFLITGAAAATAHAQNLRDLGVVHKSNPVRIVAFGDFGYRGSDSGQRQVAATIRKTRFDLGLTMGDNFYDDGVTSVDDPKWTEIWENDYGGTGRPFYATLGNHDYRGNEQAQVDYTAKSKTWRMPHRYYTFGAGPVRFFALDTDEGTAGRLFFKKPWSDEQAQWLDSALATSGAATWRIVYGHHPIFSDGHHGDARRLKEKLLPLLKKHKVDVMLAGHDHDLQHHQVDGIEFFVVGGGGKDTRDIRAKRPQTKFVAASHGFMEMEATARQLTLRLRNADGVPLHERVLTRP